MTTRPTRRRATATPHQGNVSLLFALLTAEGLPTPEPEIRFAPPRRWRIDAGYRVEKIAIEVEGAIHVQGRHTRGVGYENDMRKYNNLALLGWLLIRVSYGMIASGEAVEYIRAALLARTPVHPVASVEVPRRRLRSTAPVVLDVDTSMQGYCDPVTRSKPKPRRTGAA